MGDERLLDDQAKVVSARQGRPRRRPAARVVEAAVIDRECRWAACADAQARSALARAPLPWWWPADRRAVWERRRAAHTEEDEA